jgi:nicotinate phosphoribosyltransferase
MELLAAFRFTREDLRYLEGLGGNDGKALFDGAFLEFLAGLRFDATVDAMPEGTVVFAGEPLLRIRGPLALLQVLETPLLTVLNFETLIATKAARICRAAQGDPVIEFGLRRAQGIDGGVSASRAAFVGGCAATSNVLAGCRFGIPVRGTHAHSWVLCFDGEREAFDAYADAMPNNCVLLVDTYDSIAGVRHAIESARLLRERGHVLVGIRLDSGDLGALSVEARRMLDEAGLPDAVIVASNDLDEHRIADLKRRGARIGVWGVGTRLATAHGQPALGGIYKLSALRGTDGAWSYRLKLSDDPAKVTTPGILQVRRTLDAQGRFAGDVIHDVELGCEAQGEALLRPIYSEGRVVYDPPAAVEARARARDQLQRLDPSILRLEEPAPYPVRLEPRLAALKEKLMERART